MSEKNYSKFSPTENHDNYDHLIIGSGMGGMTLATWLAKTGKKVAIFEKHYVPGGFTHSFKRKDGLKWDVGVHYVGNMMSDSGIRKLMNFLTNHKLEWESMGEVYDTIYIGNNPYEIPAGKEKFRAKMKGYFPEESAAIDAYLKKIDASNQMAGAFFIEKSFEPFLSHTIGKIIRSLFKKYSKQTTWEVLSEITSNERLIAVLCAQCGDYGLPPKESSFAAHALVVGHFMEGGYYPHGGSEQIAHTILETISKLGGKVFIKAPVDQIIIERNRVRGIRVSGTFVPCKSVISNVGFNNTFQRLISNPITSKIKKLKIEPSIGHICLYVALDRSDQDLNLPKHNIWSYGTEDFTKELEEITPQNAPNKFAYISFPSAKDPKWAEKHPNTATIQAISAARYKWFRDFESQPWLNREEAYESMKRTFEEKMLNKLYELLPQIRGHVKYTEVSTPLSTRHFTSYQSGEIYGLAHTPERFDLKILKPKTSIKGLRLVGQDITIVGIAGAMMSGMLCAITILKFGVWKVFKDMNKPVS